jgi:hypothetical protein
MKLRLKTIYANSRRRIDAGEVAEFDDLEAAELIAGGYAVPIELVVSVEPETASTEPAVEKAILKRGRARK